MSAARPERPVLPATRPGPPPPAGLLLKRATLAVRTGAAAELHDALSRLEPRIDTLDDRELREVIAIAARTERPRLVAAAIGAAAARPQIHEALAAAILGQAHAGGLGAGTDAVEAALAGRVAPEAREAFRLRAALVRRGPLGALALVRSRTVPRRRPGEAATLAEALIGAGRCGLAVRYLRFCHRRWPSAPRLRQLRVAACLRGGHPEEARAWLTELARTEPPRVLEDLELPLAVGTGDLRTARALLLRKRGRATGRGMPDKRTLLGVLMSLDLPEEAAAVAAEMRADPDRSAANAAHFGIGHVGALYNEYRLYRGVGARDVAGAPSMAEAATHFFAAKAVLDRWQRDAPVAAQPVSHGAEWIARVPRRIYQYWNTADIPPPVAEVMQSWQSVPGWHYQRFDRHGATAWLRARFGSDHARAFRLANHVAEESDFLRLCLLLADGGIYADADDLLIGAPEGLPACGPGMVVFREPVVGAISNNVLCAPRGHPVLGHAVDMAVGALLRRESDNTWSKTGPGLLTRAAARHVAADPEAAARDLTILPRTALGRHVFAHVPLPYKSTPSYWNARTGPVAPVVAAALRSFGETASVAARGTRT